MQVTWSITDEDLKRVDAFVARYRDHLFPDVPTCVSGGSTLDGDLLMERMWKACPYRGENRDPARMFTESLTQRPELENSQGQTRSLSGDPAYQKTRHDMEES
jgi:hypothetical protein